MKNKKLVWDDSLGMRDDRSYVWSIAAWAFLAIAAFGEADCSGIVEAHDSVPSVEEALRDNPKLVLAQALVAEAEPGRYGDHRAILGVFRNRLTLPAHQGKSIAEMAAAYCSVFRNPRLTPRQRRIRTTPWEEIPSHVRALVERVEAGDQIEDPCEGRAWDFGSPQDASRKRHQPLLDCGRTENVFLGKQRRPQAPVMRDEWIKAGRIPASIARGNR